LLATDFARENILAALWINRPKRAQRIVVIRNRAERIPSTERQTVLFRSPAGTISGALHVAALA
jgi:hypothetical protein